MAIVNRPLLRRARPLSQPFRHSSRPTSTPPCPANRSMGSRPTGASQSSRNGAGTRSKLGTFGLPASFNPGRITGFGTDHTVDIGFDTQYQYLANHNSISVQASWITENDILDASASPGDRRCEQHARTTAQPAPQDQLLVQSDLRRDGRISSASTARATPSSMRRPRSADQPTAAPIRRAGSARSISSRSTHGGPSFWAWMNMKLGLAIHLLYEIQRRHRQLRRLGTQRASQQHALSLRLACILTACI